MKLCHNNKKKLNSGKCFELVQFSATAMMKVVVVHHKENYNGRFELHDLIF